MSGHIDWTEYITEEDVDAPLHAIGYSCTERISYYLNKEVQMRPGMRHLPNFGGLGELIGLDGLVITEMSRRENPGLAILDLWKARRDLNPTVGNFIKYLSQLGRRDILTDTADWIKEEIKRYRNMQKNLELQSEKVSSADTIDETNRILTVDDVVEGRAIYDAFVCFDCEDVDFVKCMIAKLENCGEFGFRFFIPGRNNLVGTNSHALTTKIISERCRHMIVVLSPSFLQSPACEFQAAYAFSLSPGARDKKIVPIKIKSCRTPDILQIMACCDFTNENLRDWCWKRLALSIMCPMPNPDFLGTPRFIPPPGSALAAWARIGMAETGGGGRSSPKSTRFLDSGFSSGNSRGGPVTAPVSSSQSAAGASIAANHTAPVVLANPLPADNRSPSTVSQAIKRLTQTLSHSKTQRKKHKPTNKMNQEEPETFPM